VRINLGAVREDRGDWPGPRFQEVTEIKYYYMSIPRTRS